VTRVEEGDVVTDDIDDCSDSASESDEDDDGVVWSRSGVQAEAYIRIEEVYMEECNQREGKIVQFSRYIYVYDLEVCNRKQI